MLSDYWRGRRVFLTGHTGFKGAWLSLALQRLGARVHGYALSPHTEPNLFSDARIEHDMASTIADINDRERLGAALAESRAETVLHLAAQAIVSESYEQPLSTLQTNIVGTANLLQTVRECSSVKSVVIVTSDKCYAPIQDVRGFREDDPLGGLDPYSASKACAEIVASAYRHSFFADHPASVATVRAGNVIGGGDWSRDRLIPDLVRAFIAGESAAIRRPEAIRPWQHVLEPVFAYLLVAQRLDETQEQDLAWNFGPEENDIQAVSWVVEKMAERWGAGASWHSSSDGQAFGETQVLKLDSSKAQRALGWRPRTTLDDAIRLSVDWYRQYAAGADVRELTLSQIDHFVDLLEKG